MTWSYVISTSLWRTPRQHFEGHMTSISSSNLVPNFMKIGYDIFEILKNKYNWKGLELRANQG
jgi:hypothetical protein